MTYGLRITQEHPSGPYVRVFDNGAIIFSGRIIKSRLGEFIVWFMKMQDSLREPQGDSSDGR